MLIIPETGVDAQALSLNRPCGQTFDDVFLQGDIDKKHRRHDQHHGSGHQSVIHPRLGADFIQQQSDGLLLGDPEKEILSEQVVIAPQEREDGHRGEGGFGRRHNDVEIYLEHIASIHVGALLQLYGHRLNKAHKDNDGEAQVAGDLWQDDGHQAEPSVAAAGNAPRGLHTEHRDDGGKHGEHHTRHDEIVAHLPQLEAEADQPVGGEAGDKHHRDGDGDGDDQAVHIGAAEVEPLHGLVVVPQGKAVPRQGDGEGVLADEAPLTEGVEDNPDEGVQGGQGPEGEGRIDTRFGGRKLFHVGPPLKCRSGA